MNGPGKWDPAGLSTKRKAPSRRQLMQRRYRLRSTTDLRRVRRTGRSYAHPLFVLVVAPGPADGLRVGVVASHSVGGAVQRNRARRLLREAVRPLLTQILRGRDLLLVARAPIVEASLAEASAAANALLMRAGLLQGNDG
jgi:ribonuclease P protein component